MSCESILTGHVGSITSVAIVPFHDRNDSGSNPVAFAGTKTMSSSSSSSSSSCCMLVATASMDCHVRLYAAYYEENSSSINKRVGYFHRIATGTDIFHCHVPKRELSSFDFRWGRRTGTTLGYR